MYLKFKHKDYSNLQQCLIILTECWRFFIFIPNLSLRCIWKWIAKKKKQKLCLLHIFLKQTPPCFFLLHQMYKAMSPCKPVYRETVILYLATLILLLFSSYLCMQHMYIIIIIFNILGFFSWQNIHYWEMWFQGWRTEDSSVTLNPQSYPVWDISRAESWQQE